MSNNFTFRPRYVTSAARKSPQRSTLLTSSLDDKPVNFSTRDLLLMVSNRQIQKTLFLGRPYIGYW